MYTIHQRHLESLQGEDHERLNVGFGVLGVIANTLHERSNIVATSDSDGVCLLVVQYQPLKLMSLFSTVKWASAETAY